jgi:hypothetical protein
LLIDQVGGFDVAAITGGQEVCISQHWRDQVRVVWIWLKVPKRVEDLHISGRESAKTKGGKEPVNRFVRIDGESGRLKKMRKTFRGAFGAPVGT